MESPESNQNQNPSSSPSISTPKLEYPLQQTLEKPILLDLNDSPPSDPILVDEDEVINVEDYDFFVENTPTQNRGKSCYNDNDCVEVDVLYSDFGTMVVPKLSNFVDLEEAGSSSMMMSIVKRFSCELCADDDKSVDEEFHVKGCDHAYCFDCVRSYVSSKLDDGVSVIDCPVPGCGGSLEPEYCRGAILSNVYNRWCDLLCESLIPAGQKFYCPFKDCSAMLVDDGGEAVTRSECPNCWRLFCAQCKVVWHEGLSCDQVQKLNEGERSSEDFLLMNLATNQKWKRCPACKFYVERTEGCLYMKCRCGVAFCYNCGAINNEHTSHYCRNCHH